MSTSLETALKEYTVDLLDSNMYEIGQWTADELNEQLKIVYETKLADLPLEERESMISDLVNQINDQLDAISDYADDLADGIESLQESGELAQANSDQRLLTDLQSFLDGEGSTLSTLSTTIPTELYRLGGLVIESDADEYFLYNTMSSNVLLGGETVRYNLTAVSMDSELTAEENNLADPDGDGIPFDFNGDGTADAQDLIDGATMPYDLSGQELYLEFNPGDKIVSATYDLTTKLLSLELETIDRTITADDGSTEQLTAQTNIIEVKIDDLAASHIVFVGEDYASTDVFKDLDPEILAIMHDQDPSTNFLDTLYPDNSTPAINEQLAAIDGYTDCIASIPDAVSTLNTAFTTTDNAFAFPADAESILQEMYDAVFNNNLLNSISEFTADEATANFYAILDKYSDTEQAALLMAFNLSFIKTDPVQYTAIMGAEVWNMEDKISVYAGKDDSNLSMVEKAVLTVIETTTGYGNYSSASTGNILTSGLAYASDTGVEGVWSDHAENMAALQFCIDNGIDTTGQMATTITYEQGLIDGEISSAAAISLHSELSAISIDNLFWKWQIDLDKNDWQDALTYLSNNLLNADGELVDDPLKVFKKCLQKFFQKDNGEWKVGADNFASTFLYACDIKGSLGGGLDTLMKGPHGKDIAKYLWNISNNGGTDPKFLSEAKSYYNSIV